MKRPFEQIVTEHGSTVYRVCRALVGPVDAEDAWSETFLSALKAYPDLDPDANIEAWLVTIAHRKAIDATRARARRPAPVDAVPETSVTDDPAAEHDELWQALKRLPAKQRQSVVYHYIAGLAHREVAAIVGGSEAAARRAASDGIATLRQTITRGETP